MKETHNGMTRTQIMLESAQLKRLRALAARRGVSMAQLVREAVDAVLLRQEAPAQWEDLFSVLGKHLDESGEPASREHDRYLDEAFGDWRESS